MRVYERQLRRAARAAACECPDSLGTVEDGVWECVICGHLIARERLSDDQRNEAERVLATVFAVTSGDRRAATGVTL